MPFSLGGTFLFDCGPFMLTLVIMKSIALMSALAHVSHPMTFTVLQRLEQGSPCSQLFIKCAARQRSPGTLNQKASWVSQWRKGAKILEMSLSLVSLNVAALKRHLDLNTFAWSASPKHCYRTLHHTINSRGAIFQVFIFLN